VSPDVISMDIRLPGMNGFEATQRIMAEKPTPIVVVSSSVEAQDLKISMNALRAGALSIVEKPRGTSHEDYEALAEQICTQLAIMSEVTVFRQKLNRRMPVGLEPAPSLPTPPEAIMAPALGRFRMMGVVASTGGPKALTVLLNGLGSGFPLPVLLVQHITGAFLAGFVSWLDGVCPLPVSVAEEGEVPEPGQVYVAPADRHLCLAGACLHLGQGEAICSQRPSGTVLFESMARSQAHESLAVLLTGMGADGAQGMKAVRDAGGYTIAQDEESSVVYGMPGSAVELDAVCESLPIDDLAARVLDLVGTAD